MEQQEAAGADSRRLLSFAFVVLTCVYITLHVVGFGLLSFLLSLRGMCMAGADAQLALDRLFYLSLLMTCASVIELFVVTMFSRLWGLRLAVLYYLGSLVFAAMALTLPERAASCVGARY